MKFFFPKQWDAWCMLCFDEPGYRPFTISFLQGTRTQGDYVLLRRGHLYTCRVTFLDGGTLLQRLMTHVRLDGEIPVHLGNAVLHLKRIVSTPSIDPGEWIGSTTWKTLVTLPASRLITMRFCSPTAFSMGNRVFKLFPEPRWVWGSLLRDWNRYAPACFQIDKQLLQEGIASTIRVAHCETLYTETLRQSLYVQKGFLGTCTYVLNDPFFAPYLTTLAAFAPYAGVGSKTTMGMGQALVTCATNNEN